MSDHKLIPDLMQRMPDGTIRPVITFRDHLALAAMQGLMACPTVNGSPAEIAGVAWQMADAMLAERAKKREASDE